MPSAILTISSRNYSSWSLRGWLLCRMAGPKFKEKVMPIDDPDTRAELLLLSPSLLVPRLEHDGANVWDTWRLPNTLPKCFRIPGCCQRTVKPGRIAGLCRAKCIQGFSICAPHFP